jgi:hypothetical protein
MKTGTASKLVALRQKTDRELLALVKTELKRALLLADVAATRESPLYHHAETILDRSTKLLPTISDLNRPEREAVESTMKEVRLALASVPAQRVQCQAACGYAV